MNDSVYITLRPRGVRMYGTSPASERKAEGTINKSVRGNPGTKGRMLARGRFPRVDMVDRSKGAFRDTRNNGMTSRGEFKSRNRCRVPAENFCVPHSEHSSIFRLERETQINTEVYSLQLSEVNGIRLTCRHA